MKPDRIIGESRRRLKLERTLAWPLAWMEGGGRDENVRIFSAGDSVPPGRRTGTSSCWEGEKTDRWQWENSWPMVCMLTWAAAAARLGRSGGGSARGRAWRAAAAAGLRPKRFTLRGLRGCAETFKWWSHFAESQIWEALGKPSPFAESPQIRLSVQLFFFQISFEFFN